MNPSFSLTLLRVLVGVKHRNSEKRRVEYSQVKFRILVINPVKTVFGALRACLRVL